MPPRTVRESRRHILTAGALFGAAIAILLDNTLTRNLLDWHPQATDPTIAATTQTTLQITAILLLITSLRLLLATRLHLDSPRTTRRILGASLTGAGTYGILEATLLHHVLNIHQGPNTLAWDLTYLTTAILTTTLGLLILRQVKRESHHHERTTFIHRRRETKSSKYGGSGGH